MQTSPSENRESIRTPAAPVSGTADHLPWLSRKVSRWLLPALFLFTLGAGNVLVGRFKAEQYEQVMVELSRSEIPQSFANSSVLERIQLAEESGDRLLQRQEKARFRVDFYRLVSFGGKIFLALSIPFFLLTLFERIRIRRAAESEGRA